MGPLACEDAIIAFVRGLPRSALFFVRVVLVKIFVFGEHARVHRYLFIFATRRHFIDTRIN